MLVSYLPDESGLILPFRKEEGKAFETRKVKDVDSVKVISAESYCWGVRMNRVVRYDRGIASS